MPIITTKTPIKLKYGKKNEQQGRVYKISKMKVSWNENNLLANMYKKINKECVDNRVWGTRIDNTSYIKHNDNIYRDFIVEEHLQTLYMLDDNEIKKEDIIGLNESNNTNEIIPIIYRCVNQTNIISIEEE